MRPISRAGNTDRGATLVEVLAMLAVIALGTMIATLSPRLLASPTRLAPLAAEIAASLVEARTAAIATGTESFASVDPVRGAISVGRHRHILPSGVSLRLLAADSCRPTGAGAIAITFSASGGSCGAVLHISQGGSGYKVRVDWYSGHVSIQKS